MWNPNYPHPGQQWGNLNQQPQQPVSPQQIQAYIQQLLAQRQAEMEQVYARQIQDALSQQKAAYEQQLQMQTNMAFQQAQDRMAYQTKLERYNKSAESYARRFNSPKTSGGLSDLEGQLAWWKSETAKQYRDMEGYSQWEAEQLVARDLEKLLDGFDEKGLDVGTALADHLNKVDFNVKEGEDPIPFNARNTWSNQEAKYWEQEAVISKYRKGEVIPELESANQEVSNKPKSTMDSHFNAIFGGAEAESGDDA